PAAGSGTVTVFGVINSVNGDGTNSTADKWNSASASFTEISTAGVAQVNRAISLVAYPNPVKNNLNIKVTDAKAGNYRVALFSLNGQMVINATAEAIDGMLQIDMSQLANGMYALTVEKDGVTAQHTIVKQ
ncbi:MAG: T9SS C-terminal target domain-containing protein, partial [Chitinophagia bacterium]|nr:T9SS C-terminal target domain-containing protein [Chitinophagia bacterium]